MNWLLLYTSKFRMRCINWPSRIAFPASSFPAGTCTRLRIRPANRRQLLTRRTVEFLPTVTDTSVLEVPAEEVKASILLFYSLLDEQQRRLYAGLESLKLGRGGDRQLAGFLDLDPHTVARGRQQLLAQDVQIDGARKAGAGRKPVEKKRPK